MIWQTIYGNVPSKSNSYRINGKALYKTKELKDYEKNFCLQCTKYKSRGIQSPFAITLNVFYPSKRSDLDNSLKVVLDCLQSNGSIKNDNLCTQIIAMRFIDKENPRIEFKLTEL